MTDFNTDYNNTELLDQELTIEQLEGVAGGMEVWKPIKVWPNGHRMSKEMEEWKPVIYDERGVIRWKRMGKGAKRDKYGVWKEPE